MKITFLEYRWNLINACSCMYVRERETQRDGETEVIHMDVDIFLSYIILNLNWKHNITIN